jgi:hypothetical protein
MHCFIAWLASSDLFSESGKLSEVWNLVEEWPECKGVREETTKLMRGRREGGKRVGSTASHWLMLIFPATR